MTWSGSSGFSNFTLHFFTPECCKCGAKSGAFTTINNLYVCRDCLVRWVTTAREVQRNWIENAFANCSPIQRPTLYRSLSKVLHPDAGGSDQQMMLLNQAYEKYRG